MIEDCRKGLMELLVGERIALERLDIAGLLACWRSEKSSLDVNIIHQWDILVRARSNLIVLICIAAIDDSGSHNGSNLCHK
jgi:hypothetical protein